MPRRTSRSATALTLAPNGPMTATTRRSDEAAFGVVDGSITVLAHLPALHPARG